MCRWWFALAALTLWSAVAADEADDLESLLDPAEGEDDGEYSVYVGRWMDCVPSPSLTRLNRKFYSETDPLLHTPGLGIQQRQVQCRAKDGQFVEDWRCNPALSKVGTGRVCVLPLDCVLGEWLPWRPRSDGALVRTRRIRRLPQAGGKECDLIEEVRPAAIEASAHWVPEPWGKCQVAIEQPSTPQPDQYDDGDDAAADDVVYRENDNIQDDLDDLTLNLSSCGGGIQRREATCVRADGKELHSSLCEHTPMPTLVQPCEVPCPRGCKVGPWKEWSACQPVDGCPLYPVQQLTTAGYSVRRRRVLIAEASGGTPCPPLEEKRTCPTPRCASWKALPWSSCILNDPSLICGPGRRNRELRCVGHDGKEAQHAWCSGTAAPARSERCRIACPGDCVVSAWSPWTGCSAPCSEPHGPRPWTTRRRHILAHASPDRWPCPSGEQLIQNETCNHHACATYSWLATPWGPCERRKQDFMPTHNYTDLTEMDPFNDNNSEEPCIEEGEMTRDVMCVQNNADVVREVLCAPLHRPTSRRACTVRCRRGCRVEAWTPWSACPNTCELAKKVRTRRVHGGPNCGPTQETRECPLPKSCTVDVTWVSSQWSDCIIPPDQACGVGYRIRAIWCGSVSHRVETGSCAGQLIPHTITPCVKPCTAAQELPSCGTICADPFKYLDTADPIPTCICKNVTLDVLPVDSDCILPPGIECGEGRSLRAARCMFAGKHVPMDICKKYHPLSGPDRIREPSTDGLMYDIEFPKLLRGPCSVPCVRDCVAGPWGQWGHCTPEIGVRTSFRFRTRELIEEGSAGGRECGETIQRAVCGTGNGARWYVGMFSACDPQVLCGHDVINRTVICIDADHKPLEDSSCEASGAGPAPVREDTCRAPCPADCVVSEWSDWSPCEQTKLGGRRDRTRVILRQAAPGGAPCPPLVAAESCTPHSYSWHLAPWDDCQPLGGSPCGEGVKKRAIQCLRSDGVFVNESFCPINQTLEASESWCYVPCGVDCVLGEWGAWDRDACSCGPATPNTHMRRTRQHLTSAVWPGRACQPTEQRAPCPQEPCLRLIGRPALGCHIRTISGEEAEGTCGWGVRSIVGRCEMTSESPAEHGLEPWRCANMLPGRIVLPTPQYLEQEQCEVDCECTVMSEAMMGAWGAWGPCHSGARSRTRQRHAKPTLCRFSSSRYVTIEWANCTGEEDELISHEDKPHKRAGSHREHYQDGYLEGSASLLVVVWMATLILTIYGSYMLYRGFLRCARSKRLKTITKV